MDIEQIREELFEGLEYPEEMNPEEIWLVHEKRWFASIMLGYIEDEEYWVEKARKDVEAGDSTWTDIFEDAFNNYLYDERAISPFFERAVDI